MCIKPLWETRLGNGLCALIERVTHCVIVPEEHVDYRVAITEKGKAALRRVDK